MASVKDNSLISVNVHEEHHRCLICYTPLYYFNSQKFNKYLMGSSFSTSNLEKSSCFKTTLSKQLHVIFIFKNVLELSSSQLETYLRHSGDPENWIKLCDTCSEEMEGIKDIYKELQRIRGKFEEAKWQIQEKISATSQDEEDPVENMPSNGRKGGRPRKKVEPKKPEKFDIIDNCRRIVSNRGTNPPPLTMFSNPFSEGDKTANLLAGGNPSFAVPLAEPTQPEENESLKEKSQEIDIDNEPMAVLTNEIEVTDIKLDIDHSSDAEFDLAYWEDEEDDDDDDDGAKSDEEDKEEKQAFRIRLEQYKDGIPCPLCSVQQLDFSRMGSSCRHMETCLNSDSYKGRLRYLTCVICKTWRCRVQEIAAFGEHIQACRDGQGFCDTIPLEQRIFSCNLCKDVDMKYMEFKEFLRHLYRFHQHSYACTKCPMRFETFADCSMAHWKLKHGESVDTVSSLLRFKMDAPKLPDIPWWCPLCFKRFSNEELRDTHLDKCPEIEDQFQPERSFKCEAKSCLKEYFWEEEVKIHETIAHARPNQKNQFFCDHCNKYFLSQERLQTHSVTLSLSNWLYNLTKKCNLQA